MNKKERSKTMTGLKKIISGPCKTFFIKYKTQPSKRIRTNQIFPLNNKQIRKKSKTNHINLYKPRATTLASVDKKLNINFKMPKLKNRPIKMTKN